MAHADSVEVNTILDYTNDNSESSADVLRRANIGGPAAARRRPGRRQQLDGRGSPQPNVVYDCRFVPYGQYGCDPNQPNNPYISYSNFDPGVSTNAGSPLPFKPTLHPGDSRPWISTVSTQIDWSVSETSSVKSITASAPLHLLVGQRRRRLAARQPAAPADAEALAVEPGASVQRNDRRCEAGLHRRCVLLRAGRHAGSARGPQLRPPRLHSRPGHDAVEVEGGILAHGTFHLTDAMNLSAGVRYSEDEKNYQYFRRNPDGTLPRAIPRPEPVRRQPADQLRADRAVRACRIRSKATAWTGA